MKRTNGTKPTQTSQEGHALTIRFTTEERQQLRDMASKAHRSLGGQLRYLVAQEAEREREAA